MNTITRSVTPSQSVTKLQAGFRCCLVLVALCGTAHANGQANAQSASNAASSSSADSLFKAKNYAAALQAYQALSRTDSTNFQFWYQLGMSAAMLRENERAAHAFEKAATLRRAPVALYNAAAMHARMKHVDSAFVLLDKAVKAGFGNVNLMQTDDDFAALRSDARFANLVKIASIPTTPCLHDPDFRRFDFWVGEWQVTTQGGTPVGKSSVQSIAGGCGLLENWTAGNGSTGKSLNTFNGQTKQWMQFWVGQGGGVTEYRESSWKDGTLVFLSRPSVAQAPFQRLSFTAVNDSTVRQLGELSTDGGSTWNVAYDFYYHRAR